MIEDYILDEVIPVPDLSDDKERLVQELQEEGFVITNFNPGGIFNMLLMISLQVKRELLILSRKILNNMFVSHAEGIWLDLRAADYSRVRKQATKTRGMITLTAGTGHPAMVIPKGTIFKTAQDINGEELRYVVLEDAVLAAGESSVKVLAEAEKAGADYNVSQGQIIKCLVYLEGIVSITNEADWIVSEGSDTETDEALRKRTHNAWADLSTRPTAQTYKNVCEAVEGVLYVTVDQMHPRGQGSVDIIVTGTAGTATETLLQKVREAAERIKGEYDNILIKSSQTVRQDITMVITIPRLAAGDGIKEAAEQVIRQYFRVNSSRELNRLILLDIIYAVKKALPVVQNIKISKPANDVQGDVGTVIVLGELSVTVQKDGGA